MFFLLLLGVLWDAAIFLLSERIETECFHLGHKYNHTYEASCTDWQLTDFHVSLEGKHCSQDESARFGNERSPDVLQEMKRIVTAVQQVQAADHIILETSLLPLIYTQNSKYDRKKGFQMITSYF